MTVGFGVHITTEIYGRIVDGYDPKQLKRAVAMLAREAERGAKLRAPVDTGRLRASIEAFDDDEGSGIKANVDYAAFAEFGTGQRGAHTDPGPLPPWYQHGPSPGMEAQPFMRPAVDDVLGKSGEAFKRSK